jgi:protein O-mannosyl-transferase
MRRHLFVIALLLLVTFGVFSRVLQADFVAWDDEGTVPANTQIQGLDAHRLGWMFTNVSFAMRYKPLCWLTYALIHARAGLNPLAYHLANLVFHCLNAVLLYFLIRELLLRGRVPQPETERESRCLAWCAGLGALAWALHPLRVEAVARVTDLTYCESLFFLLISLLCYLRVNAGPQPAWGRAGYYWGSVGAFALSMLTYPFAFGYALVLLVLDIYPLRRFSRGSAHPSRIWLEKVPFVLLGGLVLLTFLGRLNPEGVWTTFKPWPGLTVWGKAMQSSYIWAYFLWKPLAPLHLAPVYTILVSFHPWDAPFLASAGLVVGLTALLVWQRRRWPWALALWVCHLVMLAAALGLTEHPHYPSDRYSYVPGILSSVLLAAGLWKLCCRPGLFVWAVGASCVLIAGLGAMSVRQTCIWRDNVSLFEYTLAALGNDPYRADIHWRLGRAYAKQQKLDEAIKQYRLSLALESKVSAHYLLAQALQAQGKLEEALEQYSEVLRQQPEAEAHAKMGELLAELGRSQEAIVHYREASRLQPDLWPVLNNLAWILATDPNPVNRDGQAAVRLAEHACVVTGQREPWVEGTLAASYAEAGRFAEAVTTAEKAVLLAEQTHQTELAARNRKLIELYRAGKPYHEPVASHAHIAE